MQVIYLNVNANKAPEKLNIKDELQSYYNLLECNTIDIIRRKIGKRYFHIICDDEGMLVEGAENLGNIQSRRNPTCRKSRNLFGHGDEKRGPRGTVGRRSGIHTPTDRISIYPTIPARILYPHSMRILKTIR